MSPAPELLDWLLDSDPALRWQVERDLVGAPRSTWTATRARVATEGFGARLLARQDDDGQWAGGAFFPRDVREAFEAGGPVEPGQPWTATTWSLNSLREWGLEASVLSGTVEALAANCRWEYDELPYWGGEVDCCINAWTLTNGVWLGADVAVIADWFVAHQLPDGGWNCQWVEGSTRSAFASTLNSLKGLTAHEAATGGSPASRAARHRGEEYLLQRRLRRSLRTGEVLGPWVDDLTYPFRWAYSVLNALEHFRTAALLDGTDPDPRLAEAVEVVRSARRPDGSWLQQGRHEGRVWFPEDVPPGESSRWLTLYGTRVLAWWDARSTTAGA